MAYRKREEEREELGFRNPKPMYSKPKLKPKGRGTKLMKPFGFLPKLKGEPDVALIVL